MGYLFLLDRPEDVESFEQSVALQNELGVPSRVVTLEEASRLSPLAGLEGVLAATFCPLDGHAAGFIETSTVVCAAGVWSPELMRTAGVDLPVEPVFREVVTTAPVENLPDPIPLTVDFTTGFYFHGEGPGLLIGMADRNQPAGFDAPTARTGWIR